ncbi:hypothetical protein KORDIASMS9_01718 [Kordia sp. SMS9]|uniref:hypothetical protein n=1 Tax=Kordia sp. SMS9 TaxID=2282170 RepID=UPI000E1070A1|nr:hypothetical protein [Kordia sp. SMS9]AXG69495.1 hypothetical protein KORDIASMS9_01718 [Kordia sp. SMS9]
MKILNILTRSLIVASFLMMIPATAQNTNLGVNSGTGGTDNSNFGVSAGQNLATGGNENTFIGYFAGQSNTTGDRNTFMGSNAGANATSTRNTFLGSYAGELNTSGGSNVYMGFYAGRNNTSGSRNVCIGKDAGVWNTTGSDNVFIGFGSGKDETGSHKLYVDNNYNATPLIYGDFSSDKLGINTKNLINSLGNMNLSAYSMYVKGGTIAEEVRIRTGWADYVFDNNYKLMPIHEVADFIDKNGHLPNIPSAKTVESEGLELGVITTKQQEKIEELTLYMIQLQKQLDALKEKLKEE